MNEKQEHARELETASADHKAACEAVAVAKERERIALLRLQEIIDLIIAASA